LSGLKNVVEVISSISPPPVSTAIGLGKYRIPSDLRSQAEYRLVSTTVGDHVGILGAVVFFLVMWLLVVYWVIGLLGYWVIGLLGYWVIEDRGICEGDLALEHVLGGFDGGGGVLLTFRPGYSHLTWEV